MWAIYKKEIRYFFSTPVAYIVIAIYLLAISLMLWVVPGDMNILDSKYAQINGLFMLSPWLLMFLCPALTMKQIAEEKQTNTWYLLLAKPISTTDIVVGKYLAALSVTLLAQLPNLIHFALVYYIAEPIGNVDVGGFVGSMFGLMFISIAFCSIGLLGSAISKSSQIVAFLVGLLLCFMMFYGFDLIALVASGTKASIMIEWLGMNSHYESISRGVIDLRDIIYFISVGIVYLVGTIKLCCTT